MEGGPAIFAGGGELGELIRSQDWASTPLGPVETWPYHLHTCASICMNSRYPTIILWGPEFLNIYNDASRPILGPKYPYSLGRPAREVWSDVWEIVRPMLQHVMSSGESTWSEDLMLPMERAGFIEECYFTLSFAPIAGRSGHVDGIFATMLETTVRVVSERRLATLQELAVRTMRATSEEEACLWAVQALAQDRYDIPFAEFYLLEEDGRHLHLTACTGLPEDSPAAALVIEIDGTTGAAAWPLGAAMHTRVIVEDVAERFGPLIAEPWPEPILRAVALPLRDAATPHAIGFLIIGLSPRLPFDSRYERFLNLVADRARTAVENAHALRVEKKRAEALAEIDRVKTAFFANISHEFRTPLTLMLGPTEDALVSPERALSGENLLVVYRNALRLLKLVNTLLDYLRIEAGRISATYEPTDLATLTTDLASSFRSAVERGGIRYTVDCPPLPEPVYVDRDMWEKIVLNLISNAFKFTLEGEIAVRLRSEDRHAVLEVQDTGVGIPEEDQALIFDRFHRVNGITGRSREGTGIGLALARELVRLHGGEISVRSKPGTGSVFTVSIPTGKAHLPQEHIRQPHELITSAVGAAPYIEEALGWLPDEAGVSTSAPALSAAAALEGAEPTAGEATARILIADDNADMRGYLRRLLSAQFTVDTASDGLEALTLARERQPDLVLADVMMPELDGFGLLKAMREDVRTRDIPVVLLSARSGEEARIEGLEAGADDYLVKPFSAREMMARMEAQLKLARMREDAMERERAYSEQLRVLNTMLEKRVEQRTKDLKWANRILEQRNQELQDFLYAGSHDLQEPLRQIRVFDTMLRTEIGNALTTQGTFYLERIQKAAERMSELVTDLLVFSRVATHKEPFEPVDLNEVAASVIDDLAPLIQETAAHIETGPLPTIEASPAQISQLLYNLIENAIKFRDPSRTPVVQIRATVQPAGSEDGARAVPGDQCRLTVEDNGIGFDEKYLNRIFAPFQRLHVKSQYSGTGMGLAICRRIVEQHGGSIRAESEPGRGSIFIVKLPVRQPTVDTETETSPIQHLSESR